VCDQFKKKGRFSIQDLQTAMAGRADDLFTLQELVKLLEHLNILTPFQPSAQELPAGQDLPLAPEYFMPCVLQSARDSELAVPCKPSDPAPLMLRYECGFMPMGVFPSMIANLVGQNRDGWKIIDTVLWKNKIRFRVGEDCDIVTLISHPCYFEIAISRSDGFQTPTESLCSHVRGVIQSTLSTVTSCMHHKFSMEYRFGFECPTHPGREHLCILEKETASHMKCLKKKALFFRLKPCQEVWFASLKPVATSHHRGAWVT